MHTEAPLARAYGVSGPAVSLALREGTEAVSIRGARRHGVQTRGRLHPKRRPDLFLRRVIVRRRGAETPTIRTERLRALCGSRRCVKRPMVIELPAGIGFQPAATPNCRLSDVSVPSWLRVGSEALRDLRFLVCGASAASATPVGNRAAASPPQTLYAHGIAGHRGVMNSCHAGAQ